MAKSFQDMPGTGKGSKPARFWQNVTTTIAIVRNSGDFNRGMIGRHGRIHRYSALGETSVNVFLPQEVNTLFQAPAVYKGGIIYERLTNTLGNTVVTILDHEEWLARRKIIQPAYYAEGSKASMLAAKEIILAEAEELCQRLLRDKVEVIDPDELMLEFALNVIVKVLCGGMDIPTELKDSIKKAINYVVFKLATELTLSQLMSDLVFGRKFHKVMTEAHNAISKIITLNNARPEDDKRITMIDVMLDHVAKGDLTHQEMMDELFLAFSAGFETTAHAIPWLLSILARHETEQLRVAEESLELSGDPTADAPLLGGLSFSLSCVRETLRLYPPVPQITRILNEDIVISGYEVPQGTLISTNLLVLYQMHEVFARPEAFLPDRKDEWLKLINLVFGGSRRCLGQSIAQTEMQVVALTLLRYFKLEPAYGQEMPNATSQIVYAQDQNDQNRMIRLIPR